MASGAQERTTAFVTAPIVFLAAAAFVIVLASLLIGAVEADSIALSRQRDTLTNAIEQHGSSLDRELRVQTIWNEAYERTRALDQPWMHEFYGRYLDQLFGYDRIYVLSDASTIVYGYVEGHDLTPQ